MKNQKLDEVLAEIPDGSILHIKWRIEEGEFAGNKDFYGVWFKDHQTSKSGISMGRLDLYNRFREGGCSGRVLKDSVTSVSLLVDKEIYRGDNKNQE